MPRQCPADGKRCNECRKLHHFAVCSHGMSRVGQVGKESSGDRKESSDDDFGVLEVGTDKGRSKDWKVEQQVAGRNITVKIDTESQTSLLPFSVYLKIPEAEKLTPTSAVPRAYIGGVITHFTTTTQKVTVGNSSATVKVFVVKNGLEAILGLDACEGLELVQRMVATVNASE